MSSNVQRLMKKIGKHPRVYPRPSPTQVDRFEDAALSTLNCDLIVLEDTPASVGDCDPYVLSREGSGMSVDSFFRHPYTEVFPSFSHQELEACESRILSTETSFIPIPIESSRFVVGTGESPKREDALVSAPDFCLSTSEDLRRLLALDCDELPMSKSSEDPSRFDAEPLPLEIGSSAVFMGQDDIIEERAHKWYEDDHFSPLPTRPDNSVVKLSAKKKVHDFVDTGLEKSFKEAKKVTFSPGIHQLTKKKKPKVVAPSTDALNQSRRTKEAQPISLIELQKAAHLHSPKKKRKTSPTSIARTGRVAKSPTFRPYHAEAFTKRLQEVKQFVEEHGHCVIPHDYPPDQSLSRWAKRQRYQYKLFKAGSRKSSMTEERIQELTNLGFCWDAHEDLWETRYQDLRDFVRQNGHANVPTCYGPDPKLATWVKCQRRQYRLFKAGEKYNITETRIKRLEALGFKWSLLRPSRKDGAVEA